MTQTLSSLGTGMLNGNDTDKRTTSRRRTADAISLIQRLIVDSVPRPAFKAPSLREGPYSLLYARS